MSLATSLTQASPVRHGRTGRIALWIVQIALAGMFLLAGGSKLLGAPAMVGLFDAIGIGQWFRYLTGLIEVSSAIALLVPSFAVFGALALAATMTGAVATHLFIVGGSPAMPAVLLLGSAGVVWARRHQLLGKYAGASSFGKISTVQTKYFGSAVAAKTAVRFNK